VPEEGGMSETLHLGVPSSAHPETNHSRADERGSVFVEYVMLLCLVALACAGAVVATGVPLVRMFVMRQTWLLLPFP
jgi:hypothetical protein